MAAIGELEDCPGVEAETAFEVHLYIYDLSKELSKSFKKILKGKPLPDIWHTGLVAYGREYYFASSGIESCRPGETILGEPDQILTLGKTELPYSVFLEYIFALGEAAYRPGTYNLLEHNCNYFCQEVSNFLTGGPIPQELRELPQEILGNKSLSNTLKEYFDKLSLRVEGSKGISFGSVSSHQERRSSSADQQPGVTVNGDAIPNGHPHPPKEAQTHQKSSKAPKAAANRSSNSMPSVNGDVSNAASSQPKGPANVPDPKPVVSADVEPDAGGPIKQDLSNTSTTPSEASVNPENSPRSSSAPVVQIPTEIAETKASPAEVESSPTETTAQPIRRNDDTTSAAEDEHTPPSAADGGNTGDRRGSAEDVSAPVYTSRRSKKYQDPPFLFQDVDGVNCLKKISDIVRDMISGEERQAVNEIQEYLISEGGAWALGTPHLDAIGRLLNDRNLPCEVPVLTLQVLQAAALKEDIILLLHQDRKDHHIMSYLYRIENLPHEEQEAIAALMCNLCYNMSTFDWLMYISEWAEEGHSCNNSKVTVRVAVHSLLCDQPSIQDKGSALVFNLALKELFDDTATELAMAVMQYLHGDLSEELAFRSLTALLRFCAISYNDVPALMKMLGPDVRKFSGKSERVDELVEQIQLKLSVSIIA